MYTDKLLKSHLDMTQLKSSILLVRKLGYLIHSWPDTRLEIMTVRKTVSNGVYSIKMCIAAENLYKCRGKGIYSVQSSFMGNPTHRLYRLNALKFIWIDYTCQRMYRHRISSGYILWLHLSAQAFLRHSL